MLNTIKRSNLVWWVSELTGNFTIHFKKKDGTPRTMYCNAETEYDLVTNLDNPYMLVNSIFDRGCRNINTETVESIVVGSDVYEIAA
jgi:hypothetical protein